MGNFFEQFHDAPETGAPSGTVNFFAKFHADEPKAPKLDKYQQAALDEQALLKAAGGSEGAGYTRRLAHGATLGADSTILAGLQTPLEMIKHGTADPREGYNYAKAREDKIMGDSRENTGLLGTLTEALGGGVSAGGLTKAGVTAARFLAPDAGILARAGAGAADAATFGGVSGAMEGNGLQERATNAAHGALVGGSVGYLAPGVAAAVKTLASPVVSQVAARLNPKGYAEAQVARALSEGKVDPSQISLDLLHAANERQGVYNVADAMGNSGQRMLSTVARSPGQGRTDVVNALEARQATQGRRVSNTLSEGFGTGETAAQTEARLTGARNTQADAAYGAVRQDAKPVDVTGTISHIDETLGPSADQMLSHPGSATTNDSIEGVLQGFRNRLARSNPENFTSIQRIREDMADAAQSAAQNGYGNRSRLIRNAVSKLDAAMENASSGHLAANKNFAQASRDIESVQAGRDASMRGRTEDTIPSFEAMNPNAQQAFRSGYVDPLIAQTQGSAFGVNKARPLLNDAFSDEAAAIAPGNSTMQRRLGREQRMFETRNQALGGSRTVDNLNDDAAMGVSPEVIGVLKHVVTGNFGGALSTAISAGKNALTGNTAAVRQEVANILLQSGRNIPANRMQDMVDKVLVRALHIAKLAENAGRGAVGGALTTVPGQQRR